MTSNFLSFVLNFVLIFLEPSVITMAFKFNARFSVVGHWSFLDKAFFHYLPILLPLQFTVSYQCICSLVKLFCLTREFLLSRQAVFICLTRGFLLSRQAVFICLTKGFLLSRQAVFICLTRRILLTRHGTVE